MATPPSSPRSLTCLLAAQTLVVLNDNAAKFMLLALAQFPGVLPESWVNAVRALLAAFMVAPYLLFSPMAGWLADRFSKRNVLLASFLLQAAVLLGLLGALAAHQIWLAVACFFLLTVQSTLFSPAKRGILKELTGSDRLPPAVAWMETLTLAGILVGAFAGGRLFDAFAASAGDPWRGALTLTVVLGGVSLFAVLVLFGVTRTVAQSTEPYRTAVWFSHYLDLRELWRARPLFRAGLGIVFFSLLGGIFWLAVMQLGAEMHRGGLGSASRATGMLALVGLGTIAGNLAAGAMSRSGIQMGLVPAGCAGMVAGLGLVGLGEPQSAAYAGALVLLGFAAGLYLVPLHAYFQDNAGDQRRGRMLGAVNIMDNLGGIVAALVYQGLADGLHLDARHQFLALIVPTALTGIYATWLLPEPLVRLMIKALARVIYRLWVEGRENLPRSGGALVICNHVSYIDAVILGLASPRPMRFLAFAGLKRPWWLELLFHVAGVIPVSPRQATAAIRQAVEALSEGELVCIFPEGQISRTGVLMEVRKGFEVIARKANVPVVPVFIDRLWGSVFSFWGQKFIWKLPERLPYPVFLNIGRPIPPDKIDAITARQALLDLGEEAYGARPELRRHLGRECVRSLARRPWAVQIIDRTAERRPVKAGRLLAVAAALSRRIRTQIPGLRVGIVLPSSAGCTIANLAVLLAGKVPVNFNFTTGRAANEAGMRLGEVSVVLTAEAVQKKVPGFPWPERTLDLRQEILACGRLAIAAWLAAVWLLPGRLIADLLDLPPTGDRDEAALLFTSGSVGEPKGVVLSHRNLLGNCGQISATGLLPRADAIMACLPPFHSFGFTVTVWYPLLHGCRAVTLPSPLDTRKIVEAIEEEGVTVMIGAPTFLRPMLKKAERHELRSLRLVVSGAERMPLELFEAFKERFGLEIMQGYGLTETTPVANINLPDPPRPRGAAEFQRAHRLGSVGRLLPGMTARIVDPDTAEQLPLTATGMIWLRGPNVFGGYLKDEEKTRAALNDGWFVTGDLGRFDDEGFLYIEGRLSRFSKIGGEMVPHGTVEQKIIEACQIEQHDGPAVVVVGVPDSAKGEALVLLTTVDLDAAGLRDQLTAAGLPNLWIPRIIRKVDRIPVLGTGKTDLKECRQLAQEAAKG